MSQLGTKQVSLTRRMLEGMFVGFGIWTGFAFMLIFMSNVPKLVNFFGF